MYIYTGRTGSDFRPRADNPPSRPVRSTLEPGETGETRTTWHTHTHTPHTHARTRTQTHTHTCAQRETHSQDVNKISQRTPCLFFFKLWCEDHA